MRYAIAITAGLVLSSPAMADEISGDWCSEMGHHVRIEGDRITTPGGQETLGFRSRHNFDFTIPEGEADAGTDVEMRQQSEERVIVTYDGQPPQTWHRCQPVS